MRAAILRVKGERKFTDERKFTVKLQRVTRIHRHPVIARCTRDGWEASQRCGAGACSHRIMCMHLLTPA